MKYPESQRSDHVDIIHGVRVPDPYRWLEEIDSDRTREWIDAQNRITFGYLERIQAREKIRRRIMELWDYERYTAPFKRGGRYFYTKNDGLQNQNVLYRMDSLEAEPSVLLDPNGLSEDGTIALTGFHASEDGGLLAYGLSESGSDWQEWRVMKV
ncbi:MAG: S9 family peptidase, partial [Candidatus Bathyarchaeota archaeon]|nr:S9 family peptidase [Candidatus Bathyarchaeota archaeon]